MNKFLTIYLSIVESIEVTIDNLVNLLLQPLYCVARVLVSLCDVWGIDYDNNEEEEPQTDNNKKQTIGFRR